MIARVGQEVPLSYEDAWLLTQPMQRVWIVDADPPVTWVRVVGRRFRKQRAWQIHPIRPIRLPIEW